MLWGTKQPQLALAAKLAAVFQTFAKIWERSVHSMSVVPSCLACLKLEAAISNNTWHDKPLRGYVLQTPFLQRLRNCEAHKSVVKTVGCRETKWLNSVCHNWLNIWHFEGFLLSVLFNFAEHIPQTGCVHLVTCTYGILWLWILGSSLYTLFAQHHFETPALISSTQKSKLRTCKIHHDWQYSEHGTLQVAGQFTVAKPYANISFWCALV